MDGGGDGGGDGGEWSVEGGCSDDGGCFALQPAAAATGPSDLAQVKSGQVRSGGDRSVAGSVLQLFFFGAVGLVDVESPMLCQQVDKVR